MVAALIAALIAPASATGTSVKQVALTFDDGDNERHIRQAVAVAVATQTPITFFPTGKSLRRFPNLWKAIGDARIPIANHTVTHPNLKSCAVLATTRRRMGCQRVARCKIIGAHPCDVDEHVR